MELVELSTKSLAEAMFEKLGLPKSVYHVRKLDQGGYKSKIQFHHTKEGSRTSARRATLSSPICEDGEESMNRAADLAIEYMETREKKVLVDYNYYQLEQQKKAYARVSNRLLEKLEEIKQHNKTIKQIIGEACDYVEEVRAATNKIHGLAGIALDPAASVSVCNLRQAILEIRDAVVALQNTTATTCLSLQQKDIYPYDDVSDLSGEGSDEDDHQEMDDDQAHYVRSP